MNTSVGRITEILEGRGHDVAWPMNGMLVLDGSTVKVDQILAYAFDEYDAANEIEKRGEASLDLGLYSYS